MSGSEPNHDPTKTGLFDERPGLDWTPDPQNPDATAPDVVSPDLYDKIPMNDDGRIGSDRP